MKVIDISGQRFSQWLALERAENDKRGKAQFLCRCDCGVERVVVAANPRNGLTTGCGHDKGDRIRASKVTHGALANGEWHPLYNTWQAMLNRCNNPQNGEFKNYGGRGIAVCHEWYDFNRFVADMGDRPTPQHSIDRFPDNNGNYEPGNCRWATTKEQSANRRTNRFITHDGRTMCAAEWAAELGVTKSAIYARIRKGLSPIEAVTTPATPKGQYERKPKG